MGAEPEEYSLLYFLMILKSCFGFKEIMDFKDCAIQWKMVEGIYYLFILIIFFLLFFIFLYLYFFFEYIGAQEISKRLERWINVHRGGKVLKGSVVVSVTKKNSVYFVDTNDKQTFKSKY